MNNKNKFKYEKISNLDSFNIEKFKNFTIDYFNKNIRNNDVMKAKFQIGDMVLAQHYSMPTKFLAEMPRKIIDVATNRYGAICYRVLVTESGYGNTLDVDGTSNPSYKPTHYGYWLNESSLSKYESPAEPSFKIGNTVSIKLGFGRSELINTPRKILQIEKSSSGTVYYRVESVDSDGEVKGHGFDVNFRNSNYYSDRGLWFEGTALQISPLKKEMKKEYKPGDYVRFKKSSTFGPGSSVGAPESLHDYENAGFKILNVIDVDGPNRLSIRIEMPEHLGGHQLPLGSTEKFNDFGWWVSSNNIEKVPSFEEDKDLKYKVDDLVYIDPKEGEYFKNTPVRILDTEKCGLNTWYRVALPKKYGGLSVADSTDSLAYKKESKFRKNIHLPGVWQMESSIQGIFSKNQENKKEENMPPVNFNYKIHQKVRFKNTYNMPSHLQISANVDGFEILDRKANTNSRGETVIDYVLRIPGARYDAAYNTEVWRVTENELLATEEKENNMSKPNGNNGSAASEPTFTTKQIQKYHAMTPSIVRLAKVGIRWLVSTAAKYFGKSGKVIAAYLTVVSDVLKGDNDFVNAILQWAIGWMAKNIHHLRKLPGFRDIPQLSFLESEEVKNFGNFAQSGSIGDTINSSIEFAVTWIANTFGINFGKIGEIASNPIEMLRIATETASKVEKDLEAEEEQEAVKEAAGKIPALAVV